MARMTITAPVDSAVRSYRYARIGIVGAGALLAVAVAFVWVTDGPVASISALYYTPARTLFTGVLFALALALVTMAGHSLEQLLLQLAALWAPLIAVVPTPVRTGDAPGLTPACAPEPCVPAAEVPGIRLGVLALVIVGAVGVAVAVVVTRREGVLTAGTAAGLTAAALTVVGVGVWALAWPGSLAANGHVVASGVFFALMVAVALACAVGSSRGPRAVYVAVAVAMGAFLVFLGTMFVAVAAGVHPRFPWVLIGEGGLIAAFLVLWVTQTAQRWKERDPAVRAGISSYTAR